ncbi:MAG TPA: hydrogenase maturation nickel metallochaperone HypA [Tepidisphaeraceae bacterium]|jgi:hydrogenase nickel incorporation protein HypA/HybF
MHEQSIVNSLIDVVTEHVIRNNAARVRNVKVEVGQLSGVVPEALQSAFAISTDGTPLEGASLQLVSVAVELWCDVCGKQSPAISVQQLACAECGRPSNRVVRGRELEVTSIEVE